MNCILTPLALHTLGIFGVCVKCQQRKSAKKS